MYKHLAATLTILLVYVVQAVNANMTIFDVARRYTNDYQSEVFNFTICMIGNGAPNDTRLFTEANSIVGVMFNDVAGEEYERLIALARYCNNITLHSFPMTVARDVHLDDFMDMVGYMWEVLAGEVPVPLLTPAGPPPGFTFPETSALNKRRDNNDEVFIGDLWWLFADMYGDCVSNQNLR